MDREEKREREKYRLARTLGNWGPTESVENVKRETSG